MSRRKRKKGKAGGARRASPPPAQPERQSPPATREEGSLRTALNALRRADHQAAVQVLERWRDRQPESVPRDLLAEAYFRRASDWWSHQEWNRAVRDLKPATELAPDVDAYWLALGAVRHRRGHLPSAIRAYRSALQAGAGPERVAILLLTALAERREWEEAGQELERLAQALAAGGLVPLLGAWLALWRQAVGEADDHLAALPPASPFADWGGLLRALLDLARGEAEAAQARLATINGGRVRDPRLQAALAYARGWLCWRQGDAAAAWSLWEPAAATLQDACPDFAAHAHALLLMLGRGAAAGGRWEDALRWWSQAADWGPLPSAVRDAFVAASWRQGLLHAEQERFAQAAELWRQALAQAPDEVALAHNLALALDRLGEEEEAQPHWQSVVDVWARDLPARRKGNPAPDGGPAQARWRTAALHLAQNYARHDHPDRALPLLREIVERAPHDGDAVNGLCRLLASQGRAFEAVELLRPYLKHHPDDVEGWTVLGTAHEEAGDDDQAVAAWERALELEPGSPVAQSLLGESLQRQAQEWWEEDEPEIALDLLERTLALRPRDWQARLQVGRIRWTEGEEAEARGHFEQAVGVADDSPAACAAVGAFLVAMEAVAEAEVWLERAAGEGADRPDILTAVGLAWAQSERHRKQARRLIDRALQRTDEQEREDLLFFVVIQLMSLDSALVTVYLKMGEHRYPASARFPLIRGIHHARRWEVHLALRALTQAYRLAEDAGDRTTMAIIGQLRAMGHLLPIAVSTFDPAEAFQASMSG